MFCFSSTFLSESCVTLLGRLEVRQGCLDEASCSAFGWILVGDGCGDIAVTKSIPDVFLLSCVLLFGTFALATFFRNLRTTRYFPMQVSLKVFFYKIFNSICKPGIVLPICLNRCTHYAMVEYFFTLIALGFLLHCKVYIRLSSICNICLRYICCGTSICTRIPRSN